ncbi:hypothetical protein B0T26DRAFT_338057 [Lasiosphaeria miniovina]|uniref:Heterokaryon incompatibility domain-containing protein n=1 Tax=Lasiosphaeria miniovina TaxID=1954250 RepID=A0AA40AAR6_9PEZI|nr:uncharacterized protein B0T26DRAFT_338057 [Lasiosphaeria miniovina]KAK0712455.1 hypothetical protein B0T26DRAFT_338057 [Lasiosphaeria miniovina]
MGRIYAGANSILVMDPAISRISFSSLSAHQRMTETEPLTDCHVDWRNMMAVAVVDSSPWMARSWPLQEAALTSAIYVRFADHMFRYEGSHLGISITLEMLPNQIQNAHILSWGRLRIPNEFPLMSFSRKKWYATRPMPNSSRSGISSPEGPPRTLTMFRPFSRRFCIGA